jgi:hypothetical protein
LAADEKLLPLLVSGKNRFKMQLLPNHGQLLRGLLRIRVNKWIVKETKGAAAVAVETEESAQSTRCASLKEITGMSLEKRRLNPRRIFKIQRLKKDFPEKEKFLKKLLHSFLNFFRLPRP